MQYQDILHVRTSSRKFTGKQIPEDKLEKILEAGQCAPVGSSRYQDLVLTVVQDKTVLEKLAEAACVRRLDRKEMEQIVKQVSNRDEIMSESASYDPFYQAPTVIVVSHRKQDLEPGIQFSNVCSVVTCMHLAAIDEGLGSCFMWYAWDSMRRLPELDHTDLLQLPEGYEPLLGLAVGEIAKPLKERNLPGDRIRVNHI